MVSSMSRKPIMQFKRSTLDELRARGLQDPGFREGYEARDALIRLGGMLKQARESSGLTQEELAAKVGMSQPTISRLESGFGPRGPEVETIMRFVHGCDLELIVGTAAPRDVIERQEIGEAAALTFKTLM